MTKREQARSIYLQSGCTLQLIAEKIGVSASTVRSWKRRDKWDAQKRKRGAQPGNKNALYARREGNQNAVTTGEYARISFSDLSDDEHALLAAIPTSTDDLMRCDLALLCVREKRMLARIAQLQRSVDMYSNITSTHTTRTRSGTTDTTATTVAPAIDRIRDIEEALTRVQREKQRIITALNELEIKRKQLELEEERIAFTTGKLDSDAMPTIINVRPCK